MKILVIGDSWSSAVVAGDSTHGGWPVLLGVPEEMRQAVAGSTARQWANDFDGRLTKAVNTEADVVILSLLGNDAFAAIQDGVITMEEINIALNSMRDVLHAVRKKRNFVLLYTDPFFGTNPTSGVGCALLNSLISWVVPSFVEVVVTSDFLIDANFDGFDIHPNLSGHEAVASFLRHVLNDCEYTPHI